MGKLLNYAELAEEVERLALNDGYSMDEAIRIVKESQAEILEDHTCEECKKYQKCYAQWESGPIIYIGHGYCKNTFKARCGDYNAFKKCFEEKR